MNFNYNYLNIHALISHSASCLNRDNNNLQKTMTFGGVKRARISSQSLKYAIRNSRYYSKHLGVPSDRTRELQQLCEQYVEELKDKFSPELIRKTIGLLVGKTIEALGEEEHSAIIPWSISEVEFVCKEVALADKEGLNERQLAKRLKDSSEKLHKALASSVDIALSGRMITSGLMEPIDGAMALAHSFTTHSHESQLDWFTAVDNFANRKSETISNKAQAGHIGTQDFATGTFYRFCTLNLEQLTKNIGGDRKKALDIATHLVYLLATVVPSGKQNSFASFNYAEYVLCSFSDQPISFADAFERPIQKETGGGFMLASIKALQEYSKTLHESYSIDHLQNTFNLLARQEESEKSENPKKVDKPTVAKLQQWVREQGIK